MRQPDTSRVSDLHTKSDTQMTASDIHKAKTHITYRDILQE